MSSRVNVKEIAGALLCIAIGGFFALQSVTDLPIGTTRQMGPGYFPLIVGLILVALGLAIGLRAIQIGEPGERLQFAPARATLAILASPVVFGLVVRPLGLIPAIVLTTFVASMAGSRVKPVQSLLVAIVLTAVCVGVFSYTVGMTLPLFGTMLTPLW